MLVTVLYPTAAGKSVDNIGLIIWSDIMPMTSKAVLHLIGCLVMFHMISKIGYMTSQ